VKVVILAGGLGTRISEESHLKPKPMIDIGGQPILWHIMKLYSLYGYNEFIICAGYKQEVIKEYFANYYLHRSDVTFDFSHDGELTVHNNVSEPWKVTIVDTGLETMTGGRVKRVRAFIGNETCMLTYGDGVSDVNITELINFHQKSGCLATLTAIRPGGRFGAIDIVNNRVERFSEKSVTDGGWINGGFMVLDPQVLNYIDGDDTVFEREPLERLSSEGQLCAYMHTGFWQCMDTLRDKLYLDNLISSGKAPWIR
jgi:glucose-1-phosphate cytidylyltransferase